MALRVRRPDRIPVLPVLAVLAGALLWHAGPARAVTETAALADALEGGWVGEAVDTPEGPSDFALLFERAPDGSLHARTHRDEETFVDLRLVPAEDGSWNLVETAGMSGLGVQARKLVPTSSPKQVVRFVTPEDPSYLVIDFAVAGDRLALDVALRGEPHASFRLQRIPAEAVDGLRAGLEELASRPANDGEPEIEADPAPGPASGQLGPEEALELARTAVEERPRDAEAHLELGRASLRVLSRHPMRGMTLGGKCVRALERAAELDPTLAEPHRLLALYRLNAPAIGGGSAAKALRSAERYAELEPERGPAFLDEIRRALASR